jgi:hypothetical protein
VLRIDAHMRSVDDDRPHRHRRVRTRQPHPDGRPTGDRRGVGVAEPRRVRVNLLRRRRSRDLGHPHRRAGRELGVCRVVGRCSVSRHVADVRRAMDVARSVTATFTRNRYPLTVAKAGAGSGAVEAPSAGISCGASCDATVDHGTSVTLTASAASGSTFGG